MDLLKELVHVVSRNKVKQIDLLDLKNRKKSKVNQLYSLISENKVNSDDEAFNALFPDSDTKSGYYNLKTSLKGKLLNTLFFIDTRRQGNTDRQIAFFDLHKDLSAARFLLAKNALNVSLLQLEKVFKKAKFYEFTDIALAAARLLRMQYATKEGDFKKYKKYKSAYRKYENINRMEALAEEFYSDLVIHYVKNKSQKKELRTLAIKYYAELHEAGQEIYTYNFCLHSSLVRLFCYTSINDYVGVIPIAKEMVSFFLEKPFDVVSATQIAYHHQLVGYMQLKDYKSALHVANVSRDSLEAGSFNWFKNSEYHLLLSLRTKEYQKAYDMFMVVIEHRQYSSLPRSVKEMWEIYQAYLHFLVEAGLITPNSKNNRFTSFRINKFLNSIPIYSKDKSGMNVSILIIHIVFNLQRKNYDKVIDRIEAIEKYCYRYLSKPATSKAYQFIKLLQILPRVNFNQRLVLKNTEDDAASLKRRSDSSLNSFHKIEIIPFEDLWEMTISSLQEQSLKHRNRAQISQINN